MINDNDTYEATEAFTRFLNVIKKLREPDGCPWDKEQTPLSMRRDLVEETFEAVDAITHDDASHVREELGDVLLNTIMISYMYEQKGDFKIADVINELAEKLIRRHPHVFPQSEGKACVTEKVTNSRQVLNQWDRIKENLEGRNTGSILDEVPQGFPPLLKAYKMQKKAGKRGFDWRDLQPVYDKITEELHEVEEARCALERVKQESEKNSGITEPFEMKSNDKVNSAQLHLEEEIGDLLFAVVNYARHLGVDPETALNRTNRKFYRRFTFVEQQMKDAGIPMDYEHLKEEDEFWNEAKRRGL